MGIFQLSYPGKNIFHILSDLQKQKDGFVENPESFVKTKELQRHRISMKLAIMLQMDMDLLK
ncbi:hypothetical protein V7O66_11015 [Methanolobus sp. ZRKC3]|uniref:hypothetical protein n=1 Tax=Methanolobus sp. ZRKC3 TaxID=3125786 RepID=UPI00324C4969